MTIDAYLASLPDERRAAITAVRATLNANLPSGFEEGPLYSGIGWYVPVARLAKTYNGQPFAIACVVNQKNYVALHMVGLYSDAALHRWFVDAYKQTGKKLDMGKACIRFKTLDALALDVVGKAASRITVDQWIATHEAMHSKAKAARRKPAATKRKPASTKRKPAATKRKPAATKR
jgi:hypothetical protein